MASTIRACSQRGLDTGEAVTEHIIGTLDNGAEQDEGHVLADDGRRLQQVLLLGGQPVYAGGQDGLHRRRDLDGRHVPDQSICPAFAGQGNRLDQRADAFLEEERIAFRSLDQELLERMEAGVAPQHGAQQFVGALSRQGSDPELRVVALAAPAVLVLGAIGDEEEHAGAGQDLDQAVE